jgi:tRNA-specific 2-thiouridylase
MSGGVDSSVAAALLLRAGWDVVGVTMRLWGGDSDTGCCSVADVDDARRVAQQLAIDHHVFNFTEDFERHVVQPYVDAHAAGRTPNPCIECNRHLKFDRLLERAALLGFDAVATGHHARLVHGRVRRGTDRAKDQSYVLHPLDAAARARTLLPVGHLTKAEVRAEADRLGLRTAAKPDSQDVCFITARGRDDFLRRRLPLHAGDVRDESGRRVGAVAAVELVTVGQRRGLGGPGGRAPQYAVAVDVPRRVITVGPEAALLAEEQPIVDLCWHDGAEAGAVLAQCSAHGEPRLGRVRGDVLVWDRPQRRVAPGQSIVLYDLTDEMVLGAAEAA